jgi:HTH-type transcriptional regulator/antitoxin HigA
LTVRFERLDHLWFTLLHELSHVILHYNYLIKEGIISIENSQDEIEVEANRLAKEAIISPEIYRVCKPKRTRNSGDLRKYAKDNHIPPELLAGIIRRDLNNYQVFNDIIMNFKIRRSDLYE